MYLNVFPNAVASIVFQILVYGIFIMELAVVLRRRKNAQKKDKGTALILFASIFLAFFIMNILLKTGVGLLPKEYHWVTYIGFAIIIVGMIFRWYSINVLGKYFTGVVMIQQDHKIIKKGPYKILRHPSYTGGIIYLVGVGVSANDWLTTLVFLITSGISYSYRIKIEEKALLEHFGNDYSNYQKETWKMIPYIY